MSMQCGVARVPAVVDMDGHEAARVLVPFYWNVPCNITKPEQSMSMQCGVARVPAVVDMDGHENP
jgi:hypothetical protein